MIAEQSSTENLDLSRRPGSPFADAHKPPKSVEAAKHMMDALLFDMRGIDTDLADPATEPTQRRRAKAAKAIKEARYRYLAEWVKRRNSEETKAQELVRARALGAIAGVGGSEVLRRMAARFGTLEALYWELCRYQDGENEDEDAAWAGVLKHLDQARKVMGEAG